MAVVYEVIEIPQISRLFCVITFDVPDASVNVITIPLALQLKEALDFAWTSTLASQQEVCAVMFCSVKQKSFIVGADIQYELQMVDSDSAYRDCRRLQILLSQIECMSVPTFSILNGTALGGGLELALSCQYRIVDQDTNIQLGLPEIRLGVIPGGGGCCRLPRLISLRKAVEMIVSGTAVSPQQAFDIGLVDALICDTNRKKGDAVLDKYPWLTELFTLWQAGQLGGGEILKREDGGHACLTSSDCKVLRSMVTSRGVNEDFSEDEEDELEGRTRISPVTDKYTCHPMSNTWLEKQIVYSLSLQKIRQTARSLYPAPYVALKTIFSCLNSPNLSEALKKEADAFSKIVVSVQSKRLMRLFLQSRSLKKKATTAGLQLSPNEDIFKPKPKVVLIGSDSTAAAIAQGLLYSDIPVQVVCDGNKVLMVKEAVTNLFDYLLKRKKVTYNLVEKKLSQMTFEWSKDEMTEDTCCYVMVCKLGTGQEIQDSLFRTVSQARQHFKQVVVLVANSCVLTVSSVKIAVDDVDVIGMQFFDPVRKLTPCVEVTATSRSEGTDAGLVRRASQLVAMMGKQPVMSISPTGVSVSHLISVAAWSLVVAVAACFKNNVVADIDKAITSAGYTMGPFEAMDRIGIAYARQCVYESDSQYQGCAVGLTTLLEGLINEGSSGQCSGKGFYMWSGDKKVRVNSSVRHHLAPIQSTADELQQLKCSEDFRNFGVVELYTLVIATQAIECAKLVSGDMAEETVDTLAVLGPIHFPPCYGGPIVLTRETGKDNVNPAKWLDDRISQLLALRKSAGRVCDLLENCSVVLGSVGGSKEQLLFGASRGTFPPVASVKKLLPLPVRLLSFIAAIVTLLLAFIVALYS